MKAPKDREELVEFISGNASIKRNLERMGVETSKFDSYFTSERDGKELIVHWSVDGIDVPASVFEATADEDGNDLIAGAGLKRVGEQEYQNHLDKKVKAKTADDDSAKPQDLTLASWTGSLDAAIGV